MSKALKIIPVIATAIVLFFAGNVFAWSIDITPAYGDQDASDIVVGIGDQVMYQLWFNPDSAGTSLETAYVWRLDYDEVELAFDLGSSTQYDMGNPYEWYMSDLKEDPAGFVTAGAMTFSPGTTLYDPFLLADLAFTAIHPIDDDLPDLIYDDSVAPTDDGFYINGNPLFLNALHIVADHNLTNGADVAPVPIPGAIFLLIPAFLGLIGSRRKKA